MPAAAFDSALYRNLFGDAELARLFSDSAELRAMLLVEGALAKAQGQLGIIPGASADFIHRAAMEVQIDPAGLAAETGQNAVPVPGLVAAFRRAMEAPEHAHYVHWGATSQDIIDTALALRLRQVLALYDIRLAALIGALGDMAATHAALPMAARSYGQAATPTTFGAAVAAWGWPLLRHRQRLAELRPRLLRVSLGGASGTLSAMQGKGAELRRAFAATLDLADPGGNWHSNRDGLAELAGWATGLTASLGKIGEDVILLSQSGIAELRIEGAGGSSTMPQKQNPVAASVLVALARHLNGLNAVMQGAALHRQQRDGAAWMSEWLSLPQICIGAGKALAVAQDTIARITPRPEAMRDALHGGLGLTQAETLSFALTRQMPRPEAQAKVKALCAEAIASNTPLADLVARDWPDLPPLAPHSTGEASAEAHAFARAAQSATTTES